MFGDAIEDEWFIVWLLIQLTREFPATTAAVRDGDGQFLLIEAALVLPAWVTPKTAENRSVWGVGDVAVCECGSKEMAGGVAVGRYSGRGNSSTREVSRAGETRRSSKSGCPAV